MTEHCMIHTESIVANLAMVILNIPRWKFYFFGDKVEIFEVSEVCTITTEMILGRGSTV